MDDLSMMQLKAQVYELCKTYIQDKVLLCKKLIADVQQSADQETKSTAGDKYETGRAMAQIERHKYEMQLSELLKQEMVLNKINVINACSRVELGSFVVSKSGLYFLSISIGRLVVDGKEVYVISSASPIGQALLGKKKGDMISFNGKAIEVIDLF